MKTQPNMRSEAAEPSIVGRGDSDAARRGPQHRVLRGPIGAAKTSLGASTGAGREFSSWTAHQLVTAWVSTQMEIGVPHLAGRASTLETRRSPPARAKRERQVAQGHERWQHRRARLTEPHSSIGMSEKCFPQRQRSLSPICRSGSCAAKPFRCIVSGWFSCSHCRDTLRRIALDLTQTVKRFIDASQALLNNTG